jgi:hypothetical protein
VTLAEFEAEVYAVALGSTICDIPMVRRITSTSISLRIGLKSGGFVDAFYNEQTETTAFALVDQDRRVFGADNTSGWHVHPFSDSARHERLENPMSFAEFVVEIERWQTRD